MRIGVIGVGFMGSTHIKAMRGLPEVTLGAICSNNPAVLSGDLSSIKGNLGGDEQEKLDFSQVSKYPSADELLADPSIEAVDICLPTALHYPVASKALKSGKHVLLEKPMGLTGEECDNLIEEAKAANRILMIAHVLRFFPMYETLHKTVPTLGLPRSASFRRRCAAPTWGEWLKQRDKSGGGVFDLLIHDYDVALWLFGTPSHVSATGYEALGEGIDIINVQLYYANGLTVTVSGGWHHPKSYPFSMEYTVVCDGGSVEYSSLGRSPALYGADSSETLIPQDSHDGYAEEIRYFAQCVQNGSAPERCDPASSAQATKLALLCNEARLQNGEKIECRI